MNDFPLYLLEANWDSSGLTAGADDDNLSPEDAERIINNVFNLGWERIQQLSKEGLKERRDGGLYLPYCHIGYGSVFTEKANWSIIKEDFPWLGIKSDGEVLGYGVIPEGSDLERYLARVPDDSWNEFMDVLKRLRSEHELDSDATQELVQAEEWRWMKEDGTPDFYKALRKKATNSFVVFALEHITPSMVWAYCREKDSYPEIQDGDSVWLNMDDLADEPDAIEFMLTQLQPRMARLKRMWPLIKRRFYFEHEIGEMLDGLIRKNMPGDSPMQTAYAEMDEDGLFRFFLSLTPDSAWNDSVRPFWQPQLMNYGDGERWICAPLSTVERGLNHLWKQDLEKALDLLLQQGGLSLLPKSVAPAPPADHPELPLGEAEEDPTEVDPELYLHGTGGLRLDPVYRDRMIEVVQPRDSATLDTLMKKQEGWFNPHDYASARTVFVVLDRKTHEPLGAYMDYEHGFFYPVGKEISPPMAQLLKDPKYGKSVRRAFLKIANDWFDQAAADDDDAEIGNVVPHLLTFGGAKELQRRMSGQYGYRLKDYQMTVGISLARAKQYKRAAKYLGLDPKAVSDKGAWVYYDDYSSLSGLFEYEEAAEEALSGETYHWFDYLWEHGNKPSVEDSAQWLNKEAKTYLRELLINRRVYFPDEGENKQGEYIVLTRKVLDEYSDDDLLQWVVDPAQEDLDDGVFSDIHEAIVDGGLRMLAQHGEDEVTSGYQFKVRHELDAVEAKFVDHPVKPGHDRLALLVPWQTIIDSYDKMAEEEGGPDYTNSVEGLLQDAHAKNIDNERNDDYVGWPKKTDPIADSYYREVCSEPLLELEPTQQAEHPDQILMPFKESLDDPPDDLAAWIDEPPKQVEQNLLPVVEQVGSQFGINPKNIKISFDRSIKMPYGAAPYSRLFVEFDCDSKAAGKLVFGNTVHKHVVNEMAQAGYIVTDWFLDTRTIPTHWIFVWAIDRTDQWQ